MSAFQRFNDPNYKNIMKEIINLKENHQRLEITLEQHEKHQEKKWDKLSEGINRLNETIIKIDCEKGRREKRIHLTVWCAVSIAPALFSFLIHIFHLHLG